MRRALQGHTLSKRCANVRALIILLSLLLFALPAQAQQVTSQPLPPIPMLEPPPPPTSADFLTPPKPGTWPPNAGVAPAGPPPQRSPSPWWATRWATACGGLSA